MLVLWYHSVTGRQVEKKGMKRMTKLSKSVSVAELMHMREKEHLSNHDIAKRLGISVKTVYAYIGKQPAGMRKPWGSNRKKDELPPLSENTEVPEMPHESFKERCERMANELHCNPTHWVPDACAPTTAEILAVCEERRHSMIDEAVLKDDRETPEPLTEKPVPYTKYKGEKKRNLPFPELIAVFGSETVRSYLRVALYANAVEHWDVEREDMIKALEGLNKILNCTREAIHID